MSEWPGHDKLAVPGKLSGVRQEQDRSAFSGTYSGQSVRGVMPEDGDGKEMSL